jgi:outer membrane protein assembly factor BamB
MSLENAADNIDAPGTELGSSVDSNQHGVKDYTIRVWPVVVLAISGLVCMTVPTLLGADDSFRFMTLAFGGMLHLLLLAMWLLFLSGIRWLDRFRFLSLGLFGLVTVFVVQDRSLGILVILYGVPIAAAVLATVLLLTRAVPTPKRKWIAFNSWIIPLAAWLALGSDGMLASFAPELRWRWTPNAEMRAALSKKRDSLGDAKKEFREVALKPGDWPRFRGVHSDGQAEDGGLKIEDSMKASLVWKQPIGPAWSSMIVVDGLLYTQEQRGEFEAVVCMDAATGAEVWSYQYQARYVDTTQVSGVGPRSTPTFADGKIYTVGGTGIVYCLKASNGDPIWTHDLREDCNTEMAMWGFSTSPALSDGKCFIIGGGNRKDAMDVICYNAATGEESWKTSGTGDSYSSPQLVELCGEKQVVSSVGASIVGRDRESGAERWRIQGAGIGNVMLQPFQFGADQIFVASGEGDGSCLYKIIRNGDQWQADRKWSSSRLRPDFNDVVLVDKMFLGLTKGLLTCIDSENGEMLWKKLRFASGQLIALPGHSAVLVVSEQGELSLVQVDRSGPKVVHSWQGVAGKTWNHPVLVGKRVYCRSAEEIACYELN